MIALKEFTELTTLNLMHSKGGEMNYNTMRPAPAPGSMVGHFKEGFMESGTKLPQLPDEVLERVRQGKLTVNLFLKLEEYNRPAPRLIFRSAILGRPGGFVSNSRL